MLPLDQRHHISSGVAVAGIVALCLLVRIGYLLLIRDSPGLEWIDPDNYIPKGRLLAGGEGGWRWNVEAARYTGPFVKAPLYQIFLSLFVSSPYGYMWTAALGHAALGALAVIGLWSLGRDLHSERSGLIAAGIYAVYFPAITSLNAFMQERLYVPLLIVGFAFLAHAVRSSQRWQFGLAGAVLALAALTRSMPIYFVGPAAILLVFTADNWRHGARNAMFFLAGFLAFALPYSALIASELKQLVLIENIGAYGLARLDEQGRQVFSNRNVAPTALQLAQFLWARASEAPVTFVHDHVNLMLSMFQLGGGRWLEVHGSLPTAPSAFLAKITAHLFGDLPLLTLAVTGPIGFALARNRAVAGLLALWIGVHLVMTALSGYAGQRFREPFDWTLLALASCAVAGKWHKPARVTLAMCILAASAVTWAAVKTAPRSLAARADYGIALWEYGEQARTTKARSSAGFNVFPVNGVIDFLVRAPADSGTPPQVTVDGFPVPLWRHARQPDGYRFRTWSQRNRAFATIEFRTASDSLWLVDVFDYPARRGR